LSSYNLFSYTAHHLRLHSFPTRRSSDLQQVSEIMRQMLTQAQTAGQYFTNDQIKEMTRKVSAEVDLVRQQTQNQRYGSSHIGARSEERFSRNAETDLVCRLLLEKKNLSE